MLTSMNNRHYKTLTNGLTGPLLGSKLTDPAVFTFERDFPNTMLTEIVETSPTIVAPAEAGDRKTDRRRRMQPHSDVPVLGRDTQANQTNWVTTGFMVAFHVLAVVALFMFTWKAFFCFLGLWVVSINMGIGMGYHRLLTHRGYRTPKWLEYFLWFWWLRRRLRWDRLTCPPANDWPSRFPVHQSDSIACP